MTGAMTAAAVMALLDKPIIWNIGNMQKIAYNAEKLVTKAKLRVFIDTLHLFVLSSFAKQVNLSVIV
jgi:hypothetical protein